MMNNTSEMFYMLFMILWLLIGVDDIERTKGNYDNYFEYNTFAGSSEALDQYHGCTVFISFWSKSCGPCIQGFAKYKDLRAELKEEGVVIINATIDNEDEWRWAVNKYKPNGINVRPLKLQMVQRHFDIYFLPVYATLDIDGNLLEYPNDQRGDILDFSKWYKSQK